MSSDVLQMEVRGVLLPLRFGQLLLPNASVSEVIGYRDPEPPPEHAPEWLLGIMSWRQYPIPLVSFDSLLGHSDTSIGARARIAICNTLNPNPERPLIGILLRSIPHLVRVIEPLITPADDTGEAVEMMARKVRISGQEAWIPDLDALEKALDEILG
jgi:chemosensory pili system protein ChpC